MATERSNDLRAFKGFIDEKLTHAGDDLTLDDALSLWEYENQTQEGRDETLEAIRRGLRDVESGKVRPAREALKELRLKHGPPPLP